MATATSTTPTQGLRRELGLASTTSAVIGGIIAVGIFLTPAVMAKHPPAIRQPGERDCHSGSDLFPAHIGRQF
jgi:hypothetical protein